MAPTEARVSGNDQCSAYVVILNVSKKGSFCNKKVGVFCGFFFSEGMFLHFLEERKKECYILFSPCCSLHSGLCHLIVGVRICLFPWKCT